MIPLLANPWAICTLGVLVVGAGSYVKGRSDGKAVVIAQQASDDKIRLETLQLAQQAAAEEIARIQIVNRTIYAKATHEIVEKPVYRDCRHDAGALGLLNDALTNTEHQPAGDRGMPRTDTARW